MHCHPLWIFSQPQWGGINSLTAIYWDRTSTTTADVVLVSWILPIPCSCEQLQAVSCCCFLKFPGQVWWCWSCLLLISQCWLAAFKDEELVIPLHPAEQVTAVCSNVVQCWEAETSLWVPQLRELLPSSLWELSSFSKWKLRIWMCEQCLPGKAFDLPWVSQQEEFSSLELLPDSDHGTLNFLLCWADFVTSLTLSTDCFVTA